MISLPKNSPGNFEFPLFPAALLAKLPFWKDVKNELYTLLILQLQSADKTTI